MKNNWKNTGIFAGIVLLFLVLAYGFVPEVLTGKIVNQSDISGYAGMSREAVTWNKSHPEDPTYWTGSMFSGMPTTSFQPSSEGDWTQPLYDFLHTGKRPATYLFLSLLGAFLLMLSLGIGKILAVGGAIAVTFCSYNLQIIQVGHNTKMQALAFLPWVLAAVIFTYKAAFADGKSWKDWLPKTTLGSVLFALALSLQVKANHQQITYYLAIVIFIIAAGLFIWLLSDKALRSKLGRFFAASALLLFIGLVGIGTNAIKLAPLYEYTSETMRGGSELSSTKGGDINKDGLQLDYATAWSYGWEELPNLLIPNFNGGSSSGSVNPDKSEVVKLFRQAGQDNPEIAKALPLYWGPQPFTAGPMYMGAITVFLFLLGLFLYKGKEKWILLAATLVAVFLSLGNHFMWFTKLFFDYAPMYDKFRTVSMSLVVLQFTLPMLGFLVLDRILGKEYSGKEFKKWSLAALAVTAGFCLLCVVFPGVAGTFTGASDARMQDVIVDALRADRRHLLVNDALWSCVFIVLTYLAITWVYGKGDSIGGWKKSTVAAIGISALVLVNLFSVGKRYLNSDHFVTPRQFNGQFTERPVDKAILEDPAPSYRVADISSDIFNDSFNPYWHKSIGGYSPAKLQRYQDLIDRYIAPELNTLIGTVRKCGSVEEVAGKLPEMPIVSALNTKYFILGADVPVINSGAYGNAWFVDSFVPAASPDEEIALLGSTDLRSVAVIGEDFTEAREAVSAASPVKAAGDTVYMTSYAPNELRYHYKASESKAVVFSEVYYPDGWVAEVDGSRLDLFRADWILRGAVLPAGEHDIVMRFEPRVYSMGERASRASSITLLILLLLSCGGIIMAGKDNVPSE